MAVKVDGMGGRGKSVPAQGSFIPGTNTKCDSCDNSGNSAIKLANWSKDSWFQIKK